MIPVTYPSSVSTSKESQMVVFALSSVAGLQRWTDYIPVKYQSTGSDVPNSFNTNGYIACDFITSLTGKQAWVDYIPVFVDNAATTAWQVSDTGFIPFNTLAGGGTYVSLDLNFLNATALDSRITFSRGTNATLTDSNGRIAWAPHNLLTNSEDFEAAAWVKVASTVTSNAAVAPDGSNTADALIADTANSQHRVDLTPVSPAGVQTFSVYAKASGYSLIAIRINLVGAVFDLSTGNYASSLNTPVSYSSTSVGNGWYRLTVTVNASANDLVRINVTNNSLNNQFAGDGTSGIFIWGAQLNVGALQSYNSTTPKNLLGFTQEPENAAWTKSNSYVQQNLLTWSQDFDNAAWSKNNGGSWNAVTVTANQAIAPDGTLTADTVTAPATGSNGVLQQFACTANTTYTFSVWARDIDYGSFQLLYASQALPSATFTTTPVSISTTTWTRVSITITTGAAQTALAVGIGRNATSSSKSFYVWGAQLVQGATAGDYTQTTSAAAPTRYTNWDGTLTGRKLVEDTANAPHRVSQQPSTTFINGVYVLSVYAKKAERSWVQLRDVSRGLGAWFNLDTGTVGTVASGLTAFPIESLGGGWYRCSVVRTAQDNSVLWGIGVASADGVNTYTGDGTSGIYVSDFQLSNSASVDPYVYNPQAAAASAAYYGPRFDYDPVTLASRGLLIEEARANLFVRSEEFDVTATWTPLNLTVTANTDTAPNGTLSADTLTATAANAVIQQAASVTNAAVYTYSVWIKRKTGTGAVTLSDLNGNYFSVTVDATWTRFSLTSTAASTTGRGYIRLTTSGDEVYVWGAQLEAGSFATSYIPTVASQVTRNADSASMLGDNFYTWYNPNQGTLSAEATAYAGTTTNRYYEFSDGTSANVIQSFAGPSTIYTEWVYVGGVSQAQLSSSGSPTSLTKIAAAYKQNDFAASLNGATPATDTSGAIPPVNKLNIGSASNGLSNLNGTIRRINYYNTRLDNATLQALTT